MELKVSTQRTKGLWFSESIKKSLLKMASHTCYDSLVFCYRRCSRVFKSRLFYVHDAFRRVLCCAKQEILIRVFPRTFEITLASHVLGLIQSLTNVKIVQWD